MFTSLERFVSNGDFLHLNMPVFCAMGHIEPAEGDTKREMRGNVTW
jgi:hypothetical protein